MKFKQSIIAAVILACNVSAATLVNPGFESTPPGALTDGGDVGAWKSWSNDTNSWTVNLAQAHTGAQSLLAGTYGNGRQSIYPDVPGSEAGTESQTWTVGAWIYYDISGGQSGGDALNWELSARNNWNIINSYVGKSANLQVNTGNIAPNTWTYFELEMITATFDPSEGGTYTEGTDPYNNRITDRIAFNFTVPWGSNVGKFYIDDVSLAAVPEPSVLGLLALAPALALRRRRA